MHLMAHLLTSQNYLSTNPFPETASIPLYITARSEADLRVDACSPLPPDTPDLSQFLVLVQRGTCLFKTKIKNLKQFNAKLVLYGFYRFLSKCSFENTENSGFVVFDEGLISMAPIDSFLTPSCGYLF